MSNLTIRTFNLNLSASTISVADITKLFEELQKQLNNDAKDDIEKNAENIKTKPQLKELIENAYKIGSIGVEQKNFKTDYFPLKDFLEELKKEDFVNDIIGIHFDSLTEFKSYFPNFYPKFYFFLRLDFSEEEIFNNSISISAPTPNQSTLKFSGDNTTTAAIIKITEDIFNKKKSYTKSLLHAGSIYDISLLFIGFPTYFIYLPLLSNWANNFFKDTNLFLSNAFYVYAFFLWLWIYMVIFKYTRWLFPKIDLKERKRKSLLHLAIWGFIIFEILTPLISSLLNQYILRH
jgi:hypothetical protein